MRVAAEVGYGTRSVSATCLICGHTTESRGTSERSVRRCLALLRDECPAGEENFYDCDDDS